VAIAATIIDQPLQGIAANTPALVTSDSQHIELTSRSAKMIAPSRGINNLRVWKSMPPSDCHNCL
jgi:hypothetical protein